VGFFVFLLDPMGGSVTKERGYVTRRFNPKAFGLGHRFTPSPDPYMKASPHLSSTRVKTIPSARVDSPSDPIVDEGVCALFGPIVGTVQ